MGRILSIDYGVRRTGIAVTDPLQIIAGGLTTVETPRLENWLKGYLATENVERFIVGLPPQIPVELWDERYTSVMAHRTMLESGISRKARQNKALVDEISATIILQGWMESQRQREKQNTNI